MEIRLAYDDTENIKQLFAEYTSLLVSLENGFEDYLRLQDYDGEVDDLTGKYGLPEGRLYIAYVDARAAGCIAIRRLSETECEMKRLYVKPAFEGNKIGETLVQTVIRDAKEIGYQYMLLDTLPSLKKAMKLYEKTGFYRIPPYNDSPVESTLFMRLDLGG
jgi:ribosomal protein S18 acetylase RimI-like enzyme